LQEIDFLLQGAGADHALGFAFVDGENVITVLQSRDFALKVVVHEYPFRHEEKGSAPQNLLLYALYPKIRHI
jgi:hypothetical protein